MEPDVFKSMQHMSMLAHTACEELTLARFDQASSNDVTQRVITTQRESRSVIWRALQMRAANWHKGGGIALICEDQCLAAK